MTGSMMQRRQHAGAAAEEEETSDAVAALVEAVARLEAGAASLSRRRAALSLDLVGRVERTTQSVAFLALDAESRNHSEVLRVIRGTVLAALSGVVYQIELFLQREALLNLYQRAVTRKRTRQKLEEFHALVDRLQEWLHVDCLLREALIAIKAIVMEQLPESKPVVNRLIVRLDSMADVRFDDPVRSRRFHDVFDSVVNRLGEVLRKLARKDPVLRLQRQPKLLQSVAAFHEQLDDAVHRFELFDELDWRVNWDTSICRHSQRLMEMVEAFLLSVCARIPEDKMICQRIVERYTKLGGELSMTTFRPDEGVQLDDNTRLFQQSLVRFKSLMTTRAAKDLYTRIASGRHFAANIPIFHEEIDMLIESRLPEVGESVTNDSWRSTWKGDRRARHEFLMQAVKSSAKDENLSTDDEITALTMLNYELEWHSHQDSLDERALLEATLRAMLTVSGMVVQQIPRWFIPPDDVEIANPSNDELVANTKGEWAGSDVLIRWAISSAGDEANREAFIVGVNHRRALDHPHLLRFYGACHVNHPPFLVFEDADPSYFTSYFAERQTNHWQMLYEASLGLQYLHEKGVPHGRLRCERIMVGRDGKAKLSLGLWSSDAEVDSTDESDRWLAPEQLSGAESSFASDVYAFGVCLVAAFTGVEPYWPQGDLRARQRILNNEFLARPLGMTDEQWILVLKMCAFNPDERIGIGDVVRDLKRIAKIEMRNSDRQEEGLPFTPLVSNYTLENLRERLDEATKLCAAMHDWTHMNELVCDRLRDVFDTYLSVDSPALTKPKIVRQLFGKVLMRFLWSLRLTDEQKMLSRVVASRRMCEDNFNLHREIDRLLTRCGASLSDLPEIHNWKSRWMRDRQQQLETFIATLSQSSSLLSQLRDETNPASVLTQIQFELNQLRTSKAPPELIDSASSTCSSTAESLGLEDFDAVPEWFIPLYEVVFDEFDLIGRGAFGSVHVGKWLDSRVAVKSVDVHADEGYAAMFRREVTIWFRLNHANVVKLYGACHVGRPFFVCEFAGGGTLDAFLASNRDQTWRKLHQAAMGLQYLHEWGIVHGDLKCDNILIGNDGKAKLADFGLSSVKKRGDRSGEQPNGDRPIGAYRWKAPECLTGEYRPTFASDVFSFAMCIIEAVSGAFPWGNTIPDVAVAFHVKRGVLPPRPAVCTDAQWDLVRRMCRFDPALRLSIGTVELALEQFARAEELATR